MSDATLLPEWKQAVVDFLAVGFADGDVVQREWLEGHFGMGTAKASMKLVDFQARQLVWLENIEAFRRELLEKHQIYLQNVYGSGYRIIPPSEQTRITRERFEREIKKEFRRAALGLKNVQLHRLTDAERQENMDAIAKLSMLRGMRKGLR